MRSTPVARAWVALKNLGVDEDSQVVRRWMDSAGPSPARRAALLALRKGVGDCDFLGAVSVCLGDYQRGAELLDASTQGPGLAWKLEALIQLGKIQEASAGFDAAFSGDARERRLLCLGAVVRVHLGDRRGALTLFESLLVGDPKDALALALKGFLLDYAGGDYAGALVSLDRAVSLRPRSGWPLALRAQAHSALEETTACLNDLNRALTLEPEAWIHQLRSQCFNALGMAPAAVEDLKLAVKESPDNPRFHQELGRILFNNKRYQEAAAAFTQAFKRAGDGKIKILEQRAYARWYGGRPEEALADLQGCLRLDPQSGEYLRLRAARIALSCGREDYARGLLKTWRRSDKTEMRARASFLSGLIDFQRRRFSAAASAFERSETLREEAPYISAEFPVLNYSTMARALGFLEGAHAK